MPINVYCAGPIFNRPEVDEMGKIAGQFVDPVRFAIFLPHRDGLELSPLDNGHESASRGECHESIDDSLGLSPEQLSRAIFALDVYKLVGWSDAVVANLNGRVPDEGTVVEAALAWVTRKALVVYKSDARSVLGGLDNPMLRGLGHFQAVESFENLAGLVEKEVAKIRSVERMDATARETDNSRLPVRVQQSVKMGLEISEAKDRLNPGGTRRPLSTLGREILKILARYNELIDPADLV
jgi:nucleoside 2-deoxyribosyltransferase